MRKFLKLLTKFGIMISIYSYLTVALTEVLNLDQYNKSLGYWSLHIGVLGVSFFFVKYIEKSIKEAKLFFTDEETNNDEDSEQIAKMARITYTVGMFLLNLMTIAGVLMVIKGYNILNEMNVYGYIGIITYAIVLTMIYKKWGYSEDFAAINKN